MAKQELKEKILKFIEDCNHIHNNKFDYKFLFEDFKNQRSKIRIVCHKHGVFKQIASNHKRGQICRKCRDILRGKNKTRTRKEFLAQLSEHHIKKYDYSLVKNYGNKNIEKFICPIHGVFKQSVVRHLDTKGCYKCGRKKTGKSNRTVFSKKDIVLFAKQTNIDGKKLKILNFKNTKYYYNTILKISCNKHGISSITVRQLKSGTTCKKCRFKGYGKKHFVDFCRINNKNKVVFYKILVYGNKEKFYKVGITSNSIKNRFRKLKQQTGYSYTILKKIEDTPENIWSLENRVKKDNYKHRYEPEIKFAGHSECFKKIEYDF